MSEEYTTNMAGLFGLCPDGYICQVWMLKDGTLCCRHGVILKKLDGTLVCPLRLQEIYERGKWDTFFDWYKRFSEKNPLKRLFHF